MNVQPQTLTIPFTDIATIATEVWRLTRGLENSPDTSDNASRRYSVRQLNRVLSNLDITIVDQTGRPYVAGLIEQVVDIVEDPTLPPGKQIVDEVVKPTIAWREQVAFPGEIIVRRSLELYSESGGSTD